MMGSRERAGLNTPGDGERANRRTVVMQVGASASQLPPLRLVAADLAARADFDVDRVEDLRLAVDEAALELVAIAAPDAVLSCTFCLDAGQMEVTSSVPAKPGGGVRRDSFSWRVMTTLVDDVSVSDEPEADPPVVRVTLLKRRRDKTVAEGR